MSPPGAKLMETSQTQHRTHRNVPVSLGPPSVEPRCGPPPDLPAGYLYYRKEKLRGACWEYRIQGGWINVPSDKGPRFSLHHRFEFYRPREFEIRTASGTVRMHRAGAEQWFFPDRWYSLLRFTAADDRTIGYYVNFSHPLQELKPGYYQDLDLELDLWIHPDGTANELDRDEFEAEIETGRMQPEWADAVEAACECVRAAAAASVNANGPDLDRDRDPNDGNGLPDFILRA